jgi:hypothetical protein
LLCAGCPTDGLNGLDGTNGIDGVDGTDGKDGLNALDYPLELTLGRYRVAHPNNAAVATNYILLDVEAGDYTNGTYTLGGQPVTPTPVLTNGRMTTLVKIAVPASGTTFNLTVTEDGESVLNESVTFTAAGAAAPVVLYGEKFMTFSEYFHDITANIAEVRPASKAFSATGYVAEPKKFINEGTYRGANSPKWTDTDSQPKVDVISSASYGDANHFVPSQNLAMNYPDPKTTGDWHKVTGIKTVQVGVDFDLFANADLLRQAGRAVATSAAVLTKTDGIAWKAQNTIYKAKYLRPDASWGKRDEAAITSGATVAKAWPTEREVVVSYGTTWADKIIPVNFPSTGLDGAGIWNTYFNNLYAGYVEDSTGHREPLVWLQNLFTHQGHTNIEAAIQRAGISRMDSLTPTGDMKVVIFAIGFEDLVINTTVSVYDGQSSADIEQGLTFHVLGTGASAVFQNSAGTTIGKELHVTGLSAAALADFDANGGKLVKGTVDVPAANYELKYEEGDGEIAIILKDGFFSGAFQGSYSISITSSAVYKTPSFAVNRIIDRPTLQQGSGTASNADSETDAISVTKTGGNITINNEDFAKAIVTAGNPAAASAISPTVTGGLTAVLKRASAEAAYQIDPSALTSGETYTLTLRASNFVKTDRTNISPIVYYITVQ